MITKTPVKRGSTIKVTFELPPGTVSNEAWVCGEFNDWSQERTPLLRRKDGRHSVTLSLPQGRSFRFKYLIDGERWENDSNADEYIDNGFGSKDSVVCT